MDQNFRQFTDEEKIILSSNNPKKKAGRKKFKETRHPVYRGIRRRKINSNKWVCELREPTKQARIWLGTYPTAEMAARAYDVAALALRGNLACLNFADSVYRLPVPSSTDVKDIRKAAAKAAEAFRPQECGDYYEDEGSASTGTGSDDSGSGTNNLNFDNEANSEKEMKMKMDGFEGQSSSSGSGNNYNNNGYFMDDEALFDMPGLMTSMAEGLLLSPPHCLQNDSNWDDVESNADMSLWNFPF
ncbi:hypothetical protein M9H77_32752 [Catharanthus roseus]|uniref:Uncharacterized protein n=1 Tax=Catharanthus roseus TaxID=4058 RepID=A0ACC0A5N6_CATRO|nr:hypothetical protein M9H77_32752 [Catharanthus roseus]